MKAVEVRLTRKFERFLLDISFQSGGEIVVLFGPSGAGKSTTLELIAGLQKADNGFIRIGESIYFDSGSGIVLPPQKRKIGYLFQDYALFPHMTVMENIRFGHAAPGSAEAEVEAKRYSALLRLELLENALPSKLSGGERQRAALARALMRSPDILLLDEPLAAVDLPFRKAIRTELKELQRKLGIPMILVTHDLTEAFSVGDRLLVYDRGRIIQEGSPEEILERPANETVAELLGGYANWGEFKSISF